MVRTFCQGIKTVTRDLEQSAREILAVLQAVHQSPGPEGMSDNVCMYSIQDGKDQPMSRFGCQFNTSILITSCCKFLLMSLCVVPENIHMERFFHPYGRFFGLNPHPPGISSLASYVPLKIVAFETPLSLRISNDLPWVGLGWVWIFCGTAQC